MANAPCGVACACDPIEFPAVFGALEKWPRLFYIGMKKLPSSRIQLTPNLRGTFHVYELAEGSADTLTDALQSEVRDWRTVFFLKVRFFSVLSKLSFGLKKPGVVVSERPKLDVGVSLARGMRRGAKGRIDNWLVPVLINYVPSVLLISISYLSIKIDTPYLSVSRSAFTAASSIFVVVSSISTSLARWCAI